MELETLLNRIGAVIASRRKAVGLTQERLAEMASVSPKWVSQLERGEGRPSVALLNKIASALGLELEQLVAGTSEPSPTAAELMSMCVRLGDEDLQVVLATARALERRVQR